MEQMGRREERAFCIVIRAQPQAYMGFVFLFFTICFYWFCMTFFSPIPKDILRAWAGDILLILARTSSFEGVSNWAIYYSVSNCAFAFSQLGFLRVCMLGVRGGKRENIVCLWQLYWRNRVSEKRRQVLLVLLLHKMLCHCLLCSWANFAAINNFIWRFSRPLYIWTSISIAL